MKIPASLLKLLNEQFYNELYASHMYLAAAAWFETTPFKGFAKWMRVQSKEELSHAMKIFDYIIERNAEFKTDDVKKPKKDSYSSPLEAFKAVYAHEQLVTSQINKLYEEAQKSKDWASLEFIAWFVKEQVEEENSTYALVEALTAAGNDIALLFSINNYAASRAE